MLCDVDFSVFGVLYLISSEELTLLLFFVLSGVCQTRLFGSYSGGRYMVPGS